MAKKDKIQYWLDIAENDLETAKAMLVSKRYLYVGFMCHQAVEKTIKAYYTGQKENPPPFIHNLKKLADEAGLYDILTDIQKDFLDEIIPLNIEARYPTYKERLLKSLDNNTCHIFIDKPKNYATG